MLLLTSTSDLLQLVSSAAAAIDVHATFVDLSGSTVTPDRANTAITTATTTTVVASPAASTQRNVKQLSIRNKHASLSADVTVQHTDGTTAVEIIKATLPAGYSLHYDEGQGFFRVAATGVVDDGQTLALNTVHVFSKNQSGAVVALTDASTVALDAALSNAFELQATSGIGAARAVGAPTNATGGMVLTLFYYQDGSGSRALTWNAVFQGVGGGSVPAASASANAIDVFTMIYSATKSKWIVNIAKGS